MRCNDNTAVKNYVPPPIGDGELSVMLDMDGSQTQRPYTHDMTPMIWWAGRRYDSLRRELIPFGYFEQSSGTLKNWSQELDSQHGRILSDCVYADGRTLATEAFVHLEQRRIIALRKDFHGPFSFSYRLAQPGTSGLPPKRMTFSAGANGNGIDIFYEADGQELYRGVISLLCDRPAKAFIEGNRFRLEVEDGPACFFLILCDSLDHDDILAASAALKELVRKEGFDGLLASHSAAWDAYWREGYVRLSGDERASQAYAVAQYHLRISSTRWSVPTGVFASHWQARYFPFDDHFIFMALASSGHEEIARRIPEFRKRLLDAAIYRAYSYHGHSGGAGARYSWCSYEDGSEAGAPGFYLDHIFNMANIALTAWEQYRFSGDLKYLADSGYPVMSNCADFYRVHSLYRIEGGKLIVGKCTDLERLGAARENAFMTTCGVIAILEAAAAAAVTLGVDSGKASEWKSLADELRLSLPSEGGRYIPYPTCPESSVAVLAGVFPYPSIALDDPRQKAAIGNFLANESSCGNMYPVGNTVCVWYSGLKGVCFARMGDLARAKECIAQAVAETNNFAEIFEISEPAHHPWFTTAEGTFIHMVNETLLQSADGEIRILPGVPDCAFKLAARGGVKVEARLENGELKELALTASHQYKGELVLPVGRCLNLDLKEGERLNPFNGK